jgi:hypothetical protein
MGVPANGRPNEWACRHRFSLAAAALEGSRFVGWQALLVGSRRLPGITQRDASPSASGLILFSQTYSKRQQPWQILGRSREPPAANL